MRTQATALTRIRHPNRRAQPRCRPHRPQQHPGRARRGSSLAQRQPAHSEDNVDHGGPSPDPEEHRASARQQRPRDPRSKDVRVEEEVFTDEPARTGRSMSMPHSPRSPSIWPSVAAGRCPAGQRRFTPTHRVLLLPPATGPARRVNESLCPAWQQPVAIHPSCPLQGATPRHTRPTLTWAAVGAPPTGC